MIESPVLSRCRVFRVFFKDFYSLILPTYRSL